MRPSDSKTREFEKALAEAGDAVVELRLFVAGMGPRSTRAVADLKRIRDEIGAHCSVAIVDVYEHPEAARDAQIVAVPTLVRDRPLPLRKLIGAIDDVAGIARSLCLPRPVPQRSG